MKGLFTKSKGFTLIELMVVMTIMSILAAIVVPAVAGTTTAGRGTVMTNDIQAVQGAVDRYVGDHPKGQAGGTPTHNGLLPASGTDVPLDWGANFVDPKVGTVKSFAKDYLKLTKAPTSDIAFDATTKAIRGAISVTVTIPHSAAVRSANALTGALKDGELSFVITPKGIKPNITTRGGTPSGKTEYSTAPDTAIGWANQDVTTLGSEKYPVWRIDSGGNVQVLLKATEY